MFEGYFQRTIRNPKDPDVRMKCGHKSALVGLISNLILSVSKIVVGAITGAISITADGFNNLTDMLSSLVSLLSFTLANKPADREHPFGHARVEYIASSFVGLIILWAGGSLLWESGQSILNPTSIDVNMYSFAVLIFSIVAKYFLYKYNDGLGKRIHSDLVIATGLDARNDVLATAGVVVSMLLLHFFGINVDGFVGILVSIVILMSGIETLKSTIDSILGEGPSNEKVKELKTFIKSFEGVLGMHDLVVHDYGPGTRFLTVHVEVDSQQDLFELHELIDHIEKELEEKYHLNATIHMDPLRIHDPKTQKIRSYISEVLAQIDKDIDFHDFRIVEVYQGVNVIFDVLIPVDYGLSEKELLTRIKKRVKEDHPDYKLIITLDRDYHNELGLELD